MRKKKVPASEDGSPNRLTDSVDGRRNVIVDRGEKWTIRQGKLYEQHRWNGKRQTFSHLWVLSFTSFAVNFTLARRFSFLHLDSFSRHIRGIQVW